MLKCRDIAELSSDYVDGEVSFIKQPSIWWHLFLCGYCRRYMRYFRLAVNVIESGNKQEVDNEKVNQIMARLGK